LPVSRRLPLASNDRTLWTESGPFRHRVRTVYRVEGQDVLIVEARVVWDDPSRRNT